MSSALVDDNGSPRGGSGSHEADLLHELHEQHAAALRAYALRLTGDQSRAQDVAQETLLRAWRDPQVLDPAPELVAKGFGRRRRRRDHGDSPAGTDTAV